METVLTSWTPETVMALSGDPNLTKYARKLSASPKHWHNTGSDSYTLWGEYRDEKQVWAVKVDLLRLVRTITGYTCTCRRHDHAPICPHVLALLMLFLEEPDSVPFSAPPAQVQAWLDRDALHARKQLEKRQQKSQLDHEQALKLAAERKTKVVPGVQELGLWLENLIEYGLAQPQVAHPAFWNAIAARMIDAQAPGLAQWLRQLSGFPAQGTNWPERMLPELGLIYLLVQSFRRFDLLSAATQADIRAVVGWPVKIEELADPETIRDRWLVTGQHITQEVERVRTRRLWLRGQRTCRDALLWELVTGDEPFTNQPAPGTAIDAVLYFFPGGCPLRAVIARQYSEAGIVQSIPGSTITYGITAYSRALAANPWLRQLPLTLNAVTPVRDGGRWIVRDADGTYLPISSQFQQRRALLALGGDSPITISGEWDGASFMPLGAVAAGERFVDLDGIEQL